VGGIVETSIGISTGTLEGTLVGMCSTVWYDDALPRVGLLFTGRPIVKWLKFGDDESMWSSANPNEPPYMNELSSMSKADDGA
jgi:hypothetical protein